MDAVTRSFIGQLFLCFRLKGFHSDICDANIWMLFTCMCVNHVHIFFRKGSTFRVIPSWRQKWLKWVFGSKRCAMFWNVFSTNSDNFAVFCFWDMFDFVLKLCSGLKTKKKEKNVREAPTPQPPRVRGSHRPSLSHTPTEGCAPRPRTLLYWIPTTNWLSGFTGL